MEPKLIHKALKPLKRKMLIQGGIRISLFVFIAAGAVSLLMAFLSLFVVIPFIRLKLLYVLAACLPVTFIGSLVTAPSWKKVMVQADNLGLKERIITAWYLRDDPSPIAKLQREDTKTVLKNVNLVSRYKIQLSKKMVMAASLLILSAFAISFIPGKVFQKTQLREALITENKEQEKEIADTIKQQQQKYPEMTEEQLAALKEALEKLKEALKQAKTKEDALKGLAQMENLMKKLQSQDPLQDLKELENALAGSPLTEDLAKAMENEDEQALKEALEQLKKEMEEEAALDELSELFKQAAANMGDNSVLAEALQKLAGSAATSTMSSGELTQSLSDLLEQSKENAQSQQAFQQAVGEIAKASTNARRTIARADSGINQPGNNSTKTAQGEGNQSSGQGKGEGGGNQSGSGKSSGQGSGSGAGEGSTHEDAGYNEGDQPGSGRAPGTRKENEYQRIYVPERLGGEGNESAISGQKLESGSSTFSQADGAPVHKGAMVPWQEVLSEYREEAVQSMESQDIPPGLKDLVRDYFSSLQ